MDKILIFGVFCLISNISGRCEDQVPSTQLVDNKNHDSDHGHSHHDDDHHHDNDHHHHDDDDHHDHDRDDDHRHRDYDDDREYHWYNRH